MKIIVACEGLGVSPHAVHCASFMCYTVERGIIADCRNLPNPGLSAEDTAQMFIDLDVSTIITGGIDYDFANMLCHAGIEVVAGVEGSAREVLEAYINHTLRSRRCVREAGSELLHSERVKKRRIKSHRELAIWRAFSFLGRWEEGEALRGRGSVPRKARHRQ